MSPDQQQPDESDVSPAWDGFLAVAYRRSCGELTTDERLVLDALIRHSQQLLSVPDLVEQIGLCEAPVRRALRGLAAWASLDRVRSRPAARRETRMRHRVRRWTYPGD